MKRAIPPIEIADIGEVETFEQAKTYYQRVQQRYYMGVPGVGVTAEAFDELRLLLDSFRAASPDDAAHLWILPKARGAMHISTHLHRPSPGCALSEFLKQQILSDFGKRFASRWTDVVGYFVTLRFLYLLCDQGEPDSIEPDVLIAGAN
jgi:hypothetical protein